MISGSQWKMKESIKTISENDSENEKESLSPVEDDADGNGDSDEDYESESDEPDYVHQKDFDTFHHRTTDHLQKLEN
jgi:hypothetical protein